METKRILNEFKEAFHGPAWHGPSVKEILKKIDYKMANKRINDSHRIATLVAHMTAWRTFLIEKIDGNVPYDVSDELNFPQLAAPISEALWQQILKDLDGSQANLEKRLEVLSDDFLEKQVTGRNYNFYVLLHGVIQHDLYHGGQILLILKHG